MKTFEEGGRGAGVCRCLSSAHVKSIAGNTDSDNFESPININACFGLLAEDLITVYDNLSPDCLPKLHHSPHR